MMAREIEKTPSNVWKEKDAMLSSRIKPIKRLKSPKKSQECKKTANDMKIEEVFLNSEYFKYQTGNMSSLSFCSGDNGENQWTIDRKFEFPVRPNESSSQNNTVKSNPEVPVEKNSKGSPGRVKNQNVGNAPNGKEENCEEKREKLLSGILSGKGRFDRDLITLITEQMFLAERELQITRTHLMETISKLNERDLEIIQLHEKLENMQKANKTGNPIKEKEENFMKSSEDYQRLILASDKLKKQVKDMEEFLNDYGLVWVGEKESSRPDFDKTIKNFQRLNAVASHPKIIQTTLGAKFELLREIPIVLYQNGILLRNRDFREYTKISTMLFLQDVEDGYFPSELQAEFPEGVPFEVIDKRNEVYNPNEKVQIFQGTGNRLGSSFDGKPSRLVFLEPVKHTRQNESHSTHEFFDKMKKLQKRRLNSQDDIIFKNVSPLKPTEHPEMPERLIKVKIRYGMGNTKSFVLEVPVNKKMVEFEKALNRKLCERYHNSHIEPVDLNKKPTDFELHVYGQGPFRLSDQLHNYPKDCGIINNCVINITEI